MSSPLTAAASRLRVLAGRLLVRLGLREDSFLILLAIIIGLVTAAAAVAFHGLIDTIRNALYAGLGPRVNLYGRGLALLIILPAAGGLAVGVLTRFVFRIREGHGVVDVMESVMRSRGVIRPLSAAEKMVTSAATIGTGGSAGAEGPIIQIGAAIASGIGQLFLVARQHMPLLIGCGCAAGISAIFNSPIGGVFFTLEVILFDFSLRTFTPVVLASVIANVTTKSIFHSFFHQRYEAIFALPTWQITWQTELSLAHVWHFVLLGLLCGAVGVAFIRTMRWFEAAFASFRMPRWLRPAVGGAIVGAIGVIYVIVFGWWLLGREKPISFADYPLPAFFSDGYGVIRQLVSNADPTAPTAPTASALAVTPHSFYGEHAPGILLLFLASLCVIKLIATCLTLASGGSGGIIAPSLFLGATAGGCLGVLLRLAGEGVHPSLYALVGMGAALAAVVHAPLASILILLELTQDHKIILPAMLASIIATGVARLIHRDSIYTAGLRARGINVGTSADLSLLRRLTVEQVELAPADVVRLSDPFQSLIEAASQTGAANFVVVDESGRYAGMVVAADLQTALLQREAIPLLLVEELTRPDIPLATVGDDLAGILAAFAHHSVDHLPVCISRDSGKVIGLISRAALMRRYQQALAE